MIIGVDIKRTVEVVSQYDTGEVKTVFVLRPLSGAEMLDLMPQSVGGEVKLGKDSIVRILTSALVDVRNYQIGETPCGAATDEEKAAVILSLPITVINELFLKIGEINNITAEDKKK